MWQQIFHIIDVLRNGNQLVWAPSASIVAILVWAPAARVTDWHWWSHWVQFCGPATPLNVMLMKQQKVITISYFLYRETGSNGAIIKDHSLQFTACCVRGVSLGKKKQNRIQKTQNPAKVPSPAKKKGPTASKLVIHVVPHYLLLSHTSCRTLVFVNKKTLIGHFSNDYYCPFHFASRVQRV